MTLRFPGCCCFTCSVSPITWFATNWTTTATGGSTTTAGEFNNGLSCEFARQAYRGCRMVFDYSVDGVLSFGGVPFNWGTPCRIDGVRGKLIIPTLYPEPIDEAGYDDLPDVPASGTMEILSCVQDPGLEDDPSANVWIPDSQELWVNGEWVASLPGAFGGPMSFQLLEGSSASISNFFAEKIYRSRGCHIGGGTYWWPPGNPSTLTATVSFANRSEPVPGQSEIPCTECGSLSGTYTMTRVPVEGTFTRIGGGPFSEPTPAAQLWISEPIGDACPLLADETAPGDPPPEEQRLYLYMHLEGASFGVIACYGDDTWEYGIGYWGAYGWQLHNGYVMDLDGFDYFDVTDSQITYENRPIIGGIPCVLNWFTITANYPA